VTTLDKIKQWDTLKEAVRKAVPPGSDARNIVELAEELGVSRKKIIAVEQDMDDMCMNVAIGFGHGSGGFANLPKRDWSLENLGDT
jgi:hypothetical protein